MAETNDSDSFELSGIWGKLKANGLSVVFALTAAILGAIVALTYMGHQEILRRQDWIQEQTSKEHKEQIAVSEGIIRSVRESLKEMKVQTWLLSLPPDERPRLIPPEEIWNRLDAETFKELEDRATKRLMRDQLRKAKP